MLSICLNVPPLRFPEFEGEWSNLKLSEICQRIIKKNSDLKINKVFTISSEYGLVDQETFFGRKVAGENLSNYLIVKRGDFAYNKSTSNNSPWGAVRKMEKDIGLVSNLYICFRPNINKVIPDFLLEYFQSSKWYKQISSISAEGARNHGLLNMSTKDFFNINHVFPLLAEQEKISRFLTTIDKRIALQRKTIEDYENLQKALLKAKLEVADLSISNIVKKVSSNLSLSGNQGKEGFPLIGVEGVVGKVSSPLINQPGILVVKDGAGIGKSFIPAENKFSFLSTLICLIPDNKYTANEILFCLKRLNLKSYSVGSGIPHIYFKDFANLKVPTRNNKFLQVSSTYKLLSNKINMEKKIVKEALLLKKYLLMNLFI